MRTASSSLTDPSVGQEVGILWTLQHVDTVARCTLVAFADACELRVSLNDAPLLSKRCTGAGAFALAEHWRAVMGKCGWVGCGADRAVAVSSDYASGCHASGERQAAAPREDSSTAPSSGPRRPSPGSC